MLSSVGNHTELSNTSQSQTIGQAPTSDASYAHELVGIRDHLQRATVFATVEQRKETADVSSIFKTMLWCTLGVVGILVSLVVVNLFGLPSLFPHLYCWWRGIYKPARKVCAPAIRGGHVSYSALHVATAITYPGLYSMLNGIGVVHALPVTAAEFLHICVAHRGHVITPYVWAGTGTQLRGTREEGLDTWLPTKDWCDSHSKDGKCCGHCLNTWFNLSSGWQGSCAQGNPFFQMFPDDPIQFASVPSLRDYVLNPEGSHVQVLFEGGLSKLASLISTSSKLSAAGWYAYMFQGTKEEQVSPPNQCTSQAVLSATTTGVMTGGGLAFFGGALPMSSTNKGGMALLGMLTGAGIGIANGAAQRHSCLKEAGYTGKWTTASAAACPPIVNTKCGVELTSVKGALSKVLDYKCGNIDPIPAPVPKKTASN